MFYHPWHVCQEHLKKDIDLALEQSTKAIMDGLKVNAGEHFESPNCYKLEMCSISTNGERASPAQQQALS